MRDVTFREDGGSSPRGSTISHITIIEDWLLPKTWTATIEGIAQTACAAAAVERSAGAAVNRTVAVAAAIKLPSTATKVLLVEMRPGSKVAVGGRNVVVTKPSAI